MLVAALIAVYLVVTLTAAIKSEEAFLRRTFGDRYDRYRDEGVVDASAPLQPCARDGQSRASRDHRPRGGGVLLAWKATYNGMFWRTAGRDRQAGQLAVAQVFWIR